MFYQSSSYKIIITFTWGDVVLDLMKSSLDLKNHNAVLALYPLSLELYRMQDLDRTSEISQFSHLIYVQGDRGLVFDDLPKVKSLIGSRAEDLTHP